MISRLQFRFRDEFQTVLVPKQENRIYLKLSPDLRLEIVVPTLGQGPVSQVREPLDCYSPLDWRGATNFFVVPYLVEWRTLRSPLAALTSAHPPGILSAGGPPLWLDRTLSFRGWLPWQGRPPGAPAVPQRASSGGWPAGQQWSRSTRSAMHTKSQFWSS